MSLMLRLLAAFGLGATQPASALAAAAAPESPPAFADDFSTAQLGPAWRMRQGKWTVTDGVLLGRKDPASVHPAKAELFTAQRDGTVQFSFQTDQPGGLDFYFYQGTVRIAIVQLRPEGLAFATFPKTGPSEATYLARGTAGLAHGIRHQVTIERRAGTVLVRTDTGPQLRIERTGLEEETTGFLFILRGPPETTLALDDLKVWRSPSAVTMQKKPLIGADER